MFGAPQILCFLLIPLRIRMCESCVDMDVMIGAVTLDGILSTKSWSTDSGSLAEGFAGEVVFVDGELRKITDVFVNVPLGIDSTSLYERASYAYVAFICKCGKMIKDMMTALNTYMDVEVVTTQPIQLELIHFNKLILKTEAILFDFIDEFPNLKSRDSGILKILLWLNLHLNNLTTLAVDVDKVSLNGYKNMGFQLINLIERVVIISNCSLDYMNVAEKKVEDDTLKIHTFKTKINSFITQFDKLLDNAGLSTANFLKYNIHNNFNAYTFLLDREHLNFNIIYDVLKSLLNLLCIKNIELPRTIENILSVQKAIFDKVMKFFYFAILSVLKKNYFNKSATYDRDEILKLLGTYEKLLTESKLKRFHVKFISNIEFMISIYTDLLWFQDIKDVRFLIMEFENKLNVLPEIEHCITTTNTWILKFETYLEIFINTENVEYYNKIFETLQNDLEENDTKTIKHTETLNTIVYTKEIASIVGDTCCDSIVMLYSDFFAIQSTVDNNWTTKNVKNIKESFYTVSIVLNKITERLGKVYEINGHDSKSIVLFANEYLRFNINYFPTTGNIKQKLNRLLYYVMNLLDMYQIYNCATPKYRYSEYEKYKTKSKSPTADGTAENKTVNSMSYSALSNLLNTKYSIDSLNGISAFTKHIDSKDLLGYQLSMKFFWRGELKTITDIERYVTRDAFDLLSLSQYVNAVFKWSALIFFYTSLDLLYGFLRTSNDLSERKEKLFEIFHVNIKQFSGESLFNLERFNEVALLDQIMSTITIFDILRWALLLEKHIELYNVVIERDTTVSVNERECYALLKKMVQTLRKL